MNLLIFYSSYTVAVYCVSEEEIMGIYIMICWVVTMKMEAAGSSEMFVPIYHITWCHILVFTVARTLDLV
jgi:hypothetical protein